MSLITDLRGTPKGAVDSRTDNGIVTVEHCGEGWHSRSGSPANPLGVATCSTIPLDQLASGAAAQHHVTWRVTITTRTRWIYRWHCDGDMPALYRAAAAAAGKPRYLRNVRDTAAREWHFDVHVWADGTAIDGDGRDVSALAAAELEQIRLKSAATRKRNQEKKVADAVADYLAGRLKPAGNCRVCGRVLTDDTSRRRAIGPECWQEMILARAAEMRAPAIRVNHYGGAAVVETAPDTAGCQLTLDVTA